MRKKLILYFSFVLLFVVARLLFMVFYADLYAPYPLADRLWALWHGLPHDLTCAGYVMALPMLLSLPAVWILGPWHRRFMRLYLRIVLVPVLALLFLDMGLYGYWRFRLDATPLIYLCSSPLEALSYCPWWAWTLAPVAFYALWWCLQRLMTALYPPRQNGTPVVLPSHRARLWHTAGALLLCGLCFLAIRGGVTASTMNVGRVYFSAEMPLNHAATNPLFSFCYSLGKQRDFSRMYRFMSDAELTQAFDQMQAEVTLPPADSLTLPAAPAPLLRASRPNIVLILFESFSGAASAALTPGADPTIMPHVDSMYRTGIGFTHFYANSFRTDRGLAAVLAAYPGQPTYSVMKEQSKCNHLDYLPAALREAGYELSFVHGGDVNFTNLQGFLRAGQVTDIIGDTSFPVAQRLSKWGVPDHLTFPYLLERILEHSRRQAADTALAPFFTTFLTLSSHEPFEVPYHHHADPYANSVAYADSCFGSFVRELRQSEAWDNLLLIGLPDHCFASYPAGIQNHEPLRYHIPMFWTGGAVAQPRLVETYGSQTDLAATLLAQLGLPHGQFPFSKDLLDPTVPHYAFYTFSDGFGFLNDSLAYIQDNQHDGHALSGSHDPQGKAQQWGKACLQRLYDDLSRR